MAANRQTLVECPQPPNGLAFAAYWYRLRGTDGFRICTRCFEEKAASSRFTSLFERYWYTPPPGQQVCCSLNNGRAHQLFDNALHSGDLGPFLSFAVRRSNMPACPGTMGCPGGNDHRWYGIRDIPDFMACETCFEDFVLVSCFSQHFTPYPQQQNPDDIWACDIAIPFIKRCLEQYSSTQDWSTFVNASRYRLTLGQCTGEEIAVATRRWYSPLAVPEMMICETCCFDELLLSGATDHFSEYAQKDFYGSETARCAFGKFSVRIASKCLLEQDYQRWQHAMERIMTLPPCGGAVHDGEFYMLVNPWTQQPTDFGMCESCFVGCVQSANMSCLFRRTRIPSAACCEFSALNDRYTRSLKRFTEAVVTQNTARLVDYAIRAVDIHPCARDNYSSDTQNVCWWGTDDFVFCAECYDELGKDSYFAAQFKYQGTFDARPEARCDMWSDEMRLAYSEACRQQTLTEFIPFARQWQQHDAWRRNGRAACEAAQIQATTRYTQLTPQQLVDESHSKAQAEGGSWLKPSKLDMAFNVLAGAVKAEKKVQKRSRIGKAVDVLSGAVKIINTITPIMLQQQAAREQGFLDDIAGGNYEPQHPYDNNTAYDDNIEAYDLSDDVSRLDITQAEPPQQSESGAHSMLGIFNDYMRQVQAQQIPATEAPQPPQQSQGRHSILNTFNSYLQDTKATATRQPSTATLQKPPSPSTANAVANTSQQMWARHQMNMGMLQSNAAMFGMHNSAMAGIGAYGSSYNNSYDTTYQSYSSDLSAAQSNMYSGMAGLYQ